MTSILPSPANAKSKQAGIIDMTPMVDLGFLLISFFIFTTSMSETKSLKLIMPDAKGQSDVKESHVATIVLGKNRTLYFYEGIFETAIQNNKVITSGFGENGVRELLMNKKKRSGKETVVLVKPGPDCTYGDIIDILDEMLITNVEKWMFVESNENEYLQVKK